QASYQVSRWQRRHSEVMDDAEGHRRATRSEWVMIGDPNRCNTDVEVAARLESGGHLVRLDLARITATLGQVKLRENRIHATRQRQGDDRSQPRGHIMRPVVERTDCICHFGTPRFPRPRACYY